MKEQFLVEYIDVPALTPWSRLHSSKKVTPICLPDPTFFLQYQWHSFHKNIGVYCSCLRFVWMLISALSNAGCYTVSKIRLLKDYSLWLALWFCWVFVFGMQPYIIENPRLPEEVTYGTLAKGSHKALSIQSISISDIQIHGNTEEFSSSPVFTHITHEIITTILNREVLEYT